MKQRGIYVFEVYLIVSAWLEMVSKQCVAFQGVITSRLARSLLMAPTEWLLVIGLQQPADPHLSCTSMLSL